MLCAIYIHIFFIFFLSFRFISSAVGIRPSASLGDGSRRDSVIEKVLDLMDEDVLVSPAQIN